MGNILRIPGLIPGLRVQKAISDKGMIYVRSSYNIVDHRDLGEKDDEKEGGFGMEINAKRKELKWDRVQYYC